MKRLENVENILHVSIDFGYVVFDAVDNNDIEYDYEERFYTISENENIESFIKAVCDDLQKDFSCYEKVKIEAVWCACEFYSQVSEIVFGKDFEESFEESMYNEWYKWTHRK